MNRTVKRVIWFNTALHQSGGGERLSLETVRCLSTENIEAYYVVFEYQKESVFNGHYHNDKIIVMPEGMQAGVIDKVIWLRKLIHELKPDRVITQATWSQVNYLYLATFGTSYCYDAHVFGSLFAFPPELERTKYSFTFRKHFNEIRNSQKSYQQTVPEKLEGGLWRRIKNEFNSFLKYLAVRKARKLFVLSHSNQWETRLLYGKDSVVLKGAFPQEIFKHQCRTDIKERLGLQGKKVVLTVSRLAVNKRVDLCISGFKYFADTHDDAVLVIGGRGPELNNLRNQVDTLQLQNKVLFIGYVDDNDLWDFLKTCDVFVHLDLADFDIAPLEALALGQKVVWGVEMEIDEEMKNEKFIFPTSPEPKQVSESINRAIACTISCDDILKYREQLSKYSWEDYASSMIKDLRITS